jgi:hypothetical protein
LAGGFQQFLSFIGLMKNAVPLLAGAGGHVEIYQQASDHQAGADLNKNFLHFNLLCRSTAGVMPLMAGAPKPAGERLAQESAK